MLVLTRPDPLTVSGADWRLPCSERTHLTRREVVADVFMSPKTLTDLGEVLCHESLADPFHTLSFHTLSGL